MQAAPKIMQGVFQETGVVLDADGDDIHVETSSGRFRARRAVSCLVCPEVDDQVLLMVPPEGDLRVLSVLGRPSGRPIRVVVGGDASFDSSGTLRLGGVEGVELRSARRVHTAAPEVRIEAAEGSIGIEKLSYVGRFVEAHTESIKGVLGTLDTFLERATEHVKRSYRYVEELEVTRAQEVDCRVEKTWSVRSKNTFIRTRELAKVMAAQIHLG